MNVSPRPYLSAKLAGIGGEIKSRPEDFEVEEIPLYEPCGEGHHAYLWVEKSGVTGNQLVSDIARHFGVAKRDVGAAGIKDKHALTRQWISIPFYELETDDPSTLIGPINPRINVLDAQLHRNKLRTGHLAGNRFRVVLRDLALPGAEALARAEAILAALGAQGLPNYYGEQRFGIDGQTLALGVGLLRGEKDARDRVKRDRFIKRLAISAVQSELFNRVLIARLKQGMLATAMDGDVAQKTDTNGVFAIPTDELDACQQRLERGELVLTGPMLGAKMITPERDAKAFEDGIFAESGFDIGLFDTQKQLASGTRRPLLVNPGDLSASLETQDEQEVLVLQFSLPSGSYATVLLREIMKSDA